MAAVHQTDLSKIKNCEKLESLETEIWTNSFIINFSVNNTLEIGHLAPCTNGFLETVRYLENDKSGGKPVLNTFNNNNNSSSGDYSE